MKLPADQRGSQATKDMAKERPVDTTEVSTNHFQEKAAKFLDELHRIDLVSHVGVVAGRDDYKYPFVNLYALLKPEGREHGKKLLALDRSFNDFAHAVRPDLFVYLHLMDPVPPEELNQALKNMCRQTHRQLIGFEEVTSPYLNGSAKNGNGRAKNGSTRAK